MMTTANQVLRFWYYGMVLISVCNIATFVRLAMKPYTARVSKRYQFLMRFFAFFYVLGCAYRAILPRIDVERICWHDTWYSSTFLGRIAATLAELSYMAQISIAHSRIAVDVLTKVPERDNKFLKSIIRLSSISYLLFIPANFVAQSFCWMGVTTTFQFWHVYEESIWAVTVLLITASCGVLLHALNKHYPATATRLQGREVVVKFLRIGLVFGAAFVVYMFTVDIPLYWNRCARDSAYGKPYLSFSAGVCIQSIYSVSFVSDMLQDWRGDISWITGYFSVAVWSSLWLMNAPALRIGNKNT